MTFYPPSLDVRPLTTWPGVLSTSRTRDRATWDRLEQAKHVLDQHAGGPR